MADEMEPSRRCDPQGLKGKLHSFLAGSDVSGRPLTFVERTECAIVLLQSLPCARGAVLEQLCGVFREAVQKYTVQLERQALEETLGEVALDDPNLNSALCRVSELVRGFVDNNPSSWAPVICQWSLTLLGQVITENAGRRGVSLNLSFSEGMHRWMAFPAIQLLIDIASHCCAELVICSCDVCMSCLLQTAVKYSPHLDWIVAHIGSHFHQVIIGKLLSTALKEYGSCVHGEHAGKSGVLIATVVRVLTLLSLQHLHEITTCLLDMFHASLSSSSAENRATQLATVPFLLHLASSSPELLRGTLSEFVETLTPAVLVQLYNQSIEREQFETKPESLTSSLVDIMVNTAEGANEIFKFVLENCEPAEGKGPMDFDDTQGQVQQTFVRIVELLLLELDRTVLHRRKLFKECLLTNQSGRVDSPFLQEMANHTHALCNTLMSASGNRLMWLRRLLVLVALYKGQLVAVQILTHVLMNARTDDSLRLFIKLQCELELSYPHLLRDTVNKCVIFLKNLPSAVASTRAVLLLENFHQLVLTEKTSQLPPRVKLSPLLEEQCEVLSGLVSHVDRRLSVNAMELLLEFEKPLSPATAKAKRNVCRNAVAFFFSSLRELHRDERKTPVVAEAVKLCRTVLLHLTKDALCTPHILRLLVEGTLEKENLHLFGGKAHPPADPETSLSPEGCVSLLEYNMKPQISSRLPLNPSSVFFTGVVGKNNVAKPSRENEARQGFEEPGLGDTLFIFQPWSCARQVFLDVLHSVCTNGPEVTQTDAGHTSGPRHHCLDVIASLLMEHVCPDVVPSPNDWNDEDGIKSMVERNLKIYRKLDDNPILWTFLLFVTKSSKALLRCVLMVSSLLATLVSYWELCRDATVQRTSSHFLNTCYVTQVLTEAEWIPPPLCRVGAILHLLSPKDLFTLLNTMWKVLKENPPNVLPTPEPSRPRWQQGTAVSQREVVKSVFVKNIGKLGQHYAGVFSSSS